jgi:hypothetical protein
MLQQIIAKLSTQQIMMGIATASTLLFLLLRLFSGKKNLASRSSDGLVSYAPSTSTHAHKLQTTGEPTTEAGTDGAVIGASTHVPITSSIEASLNPNSNKAPKVQVSAPSYAVGDQKVEQERLSKQKKRRPPRVQPSMLTLIALASLTYEGTVKAWAADPSKAPSEVLAGAAIDTEAAGAKDVSVSAPSNNVVSSGPDTTSPGPLLASFFNRPAAQGWTSTRFDGVASLRQQVIQAQIPDFQTLVAEYRSILFSKEGQITPQIANDGMGIAQMSMEPMSTGVESVRVSSFKTLISDYKNVVFTLPGQQASEGKQTEIALSEVVHISNSTATEEREHRGDGVQLAHWAQGIVHSHENLSMTSEAALAAAIAAATSDFATAPPHLMPSRQVIQTTQQKV